MNKLSGCCEIRHRSNPYYQEAAKYLGKKPEELKIVTCHLGNGSSITAVNGGKSVDTSMGFTPLAGVPMAVKDNLCTVGILTTCASKILENF